MRQTFGTNPQTRSTQELVEAQAADPEADASKTSSHSTGIESRQWRLRSDHLPTRQTTMEDGPINMNGGKVRLAIPSGWKIGIDNIASITDGGIGLYLTSARLTDDAELTGELILG